MKRKNEVDFIRKKVESENEKGLLLLLIFIMPINASIVYMYNFKGNIKTLCFLIRQPLSTPIPTYTQENCGK